MINHVIDLFSFVTKFCRDRSRKAPLSHRSEDPALQQLPVSFHRRRISYILCSLLFPDTENKTFYFPWYDPPCSRYIHFLHKSRIIYLPPQICGYNHVNIKLYKRKRRIFKTVFFLSITFIFNQKTESPSASVHVPGLSVRIQICRRPQGSF